MTTKAIILYIAGLIGIVAVIVWLGAGTSTAPVMGTNDPNRPIASVEKSDFDFGMMRNEDIRTADFTISNTGASDLVLQGVSTSCDCTYAYITVGGEKSPRFIMHDKSSWRGVVPPGQSAEVEVVYEPAIMPVFGPVSRMVTVTTNDPNQQSVQFTVIANVER